MIVGPTFIFDYSVMMFLKIFLHLAFHHYDLALFAFSFQNPNLFLLGVSVPYCLKLPILTLNKLMALVHFEWFKYKNASGVKPW